MNTVEPSFATADVLAFYRELPFNYRESAVEHARHIRQVFPGFFSVLARKAQCDSAGTDRKGSALNEQVAISVVLFLARAVIFAARRATNPRHAHPRAV